MARIKCTPDNLESVINNIYDEYLNKVTDNVQEDVTDIGKTCKKLVKSYASASGMKAGKYLNSFKTTVDKSNYVTSVTIHSKMYQIAHLLENGHVIKKNGVPIGTTRAFKHFAPAEEKAIEMLEEKIKLTIGSDA